MISNTWGVTPPADVDGMFDTVVLSGREGMRKPQPETCPAKFRKLLHRHVSENRKMFSGGSEILPQREDIDVVRM